MTETKAALIVGAGSGLGAALARRFSGAGLSVAVAARHQPDLAAVAEAMGPSVRPYRCDATREAEVDALFRAVEQDLGKLAVVVHNVGVFSRKSILESTVEDVETSWRGACLSGFLTGRAAARVMVPRGEGVVLFTGATGSLRGSALFQNSAMAKSAVRTLSQSMARELGPKGVHVAHVVIDGGIDRGGNGSASADSDPKLQPDDIAEAYFQLFAQKRSAWTQELDLRTWKERF
jgi:NAD(P)-dependent dehydrogenase (short-subunit alcohol dehydrogenase family)